MSTLESPKSPPRTVARNSSSRKFLDDVNVRTEGIGKAAWQLEDTQQDRLVKDYPQNPEAREAFFCVAEAEVDYRWCLFVLLVLTIFETPAWCNSGWTAKYHFTPFDPHVICTIQDPRNASATVQPEYVLLSGIPYIPIGWGIIIEVYIIYKMARKMILQYRLQVDHFDPIEVADEEGRPKLGVEYFNKTVIYFGLCMVVIELVDCIWFIWYTPTYRFAFIPRTGYLCLLPAVRRLGEMVIAVMPQFFSIGIFFVSMVVFFAWIVVIMFKDVEGMMDGKPVNQGLDTFRHSLNTIAVAGTTDDFMACFLKPYTALRWSGLLWAVFLVVVQVLLLSLVLDSLVYAYMEYAETKEKEVIKEKIDGIFAAFKTLSQAQGRGTHGSASDEREKGEGEEEEEEASITKATFLDFVREFSRSPCTRRITTATANIIFTAVDVDGSRELDKNEFCSICGVMQYDFWTTVKYSFIRDSYPDTWNHPRFQKLIEFVEKGLFVPGFSVWFPGWLMTFDFFMNLVLTVNLVFVVTETSFDLQGWQEPVILEHLELAFAFIYVGEVAIKLCVYSFDEYWSFRSNQFDFGTTWLLLASSIADELMEGNASSEVKRYMNILRILRLLRVMKRLRGLPVVTRMVETVYRLVLASVDILTMLGVVVYFFTTLSVQLWGGLLYMTNPALEESEYAENKHYVLNFNDIPMAFGVWVVTLLCEYVPEFPDVVEQVSPWPFTWIVFPIFYVFAVSVVFELVKAFTIEIFISMWGDKKKTSGKSEEDSVFKPIEDLKKTFAEDGLSLHYKLCGDEQLQPKIAEALEERFGEMAEDDSQASSKGKSPRDGHHD